MKLLKKKRVFAWFLVLVMFVGIFSTSVYANNFQLGLTACKYYKITEKNIYQLAPGATETEIILNYPEGGTRNVVRAIEVDPSHDNISVVPTYHKDNVSGSSTWKTQKLIAQLADLEAQGKNVVGAMNVCLHWGSKPCGLLIYEGQTIYDNRNTVECGGYLVIRTDGKAEIREPNEELQGNEWMAQSTCFGFVVKDGKSVYTGEDHASSNRDTRSLIGVKADGSIVLMVNEGESGSNSAGMTTHELAETMLAFGCVDAIRCDGGGSSALITERVGTQTLSAKNSPFENRNIYVGIAVISQAVSDGVFKTATLKTTRTKIDLGGSATISAVGTDAAGGVTDLPENLTFELEDDSYGSIVGGVFTAGDKAGTAVINAVSDNKVVGSIAINVIKPHGWRIINYLKYYFNEGNPLSGTRRVQSHSNPLEYVWYDFGEDGLCGEQADGLREVDGVPYYFENGKAQTGLREVDGSYYFFGYSGAEKGECYVWETQCDLPCGTYYFGEDYKALDGLVEKEDGLYYYVNGKIGEAGLTKIGMAYYVIEEDGKCGTGKYYVGTTNCDRPIGNYEFGMDGKMK